MTDLAEFLLARIAEDEEAAKDLHMGSPQWSSGHSRVDSKTPYALYGELNAVVISMSTHSRFADYIARWDPARVLAKCEADRRIVTSYRSFALVQSRKTGGDAVLAGVYVRALEIALKYLALPYADHADYRQEWRPR